LLQTQLCAAEFGVPTAADKEPPTTEELSRFLAITPLTLNAYLDRYVADGLLVHEAGAFTLSPAGEESGKRTFADEMADLTKSTHGECAPDCWCHESPEAAADCLHNAMGVAHSR